MTEIPVEYSFTGKANVVLLFNQRQHATGVISTVHARSENKSDEKAFRCSGPVRFTAKTVRHIEDVLIPLLQSILAPLSLHRQSYHTWIVNISAASAHDIGLDISGFSADCALLLAMLSASLEMEIPSSILSTGHIASPAGEIRMVSGLPAKLEAALRSGNIDTFIHPSMDGDASMSLFSPDERESTADALIRAEQSLRTVGVRDIHELIQAAFTDDQIVLASLRKGFYSACNFGPENDTAASRALVHISGNNPHRFWTVLERQLLTGQTAEAKELMIAFFRFFLSQGAYPKHFGNRLFRLVASLPPQTRRSKVLFPIAPIPECIRLGRLARETDHEDVLLLFRGASGDLSVSLRKPRNSREVNRIEFEDKPLQHILSEMDPDRLTSLIGLPIDAARGVYVMDSVILTSYEQFVDTITSFYIHMMRHYRKIPEPADVNAAGSEALGLLEKAFARNGGFKGALAEARHGTKGGLKFILDSMTQELKRQEQEKYINYAIKSALDPLDREAKKHLIRSILEQLKPLLPPDVLSQPVEMFVDHYETIIRSYIQSFSQVTSLLRSL